MSDSRSPKKPPQKPCHGPVAYKQLAGQYKTLIQCVLTGQTMLETNTYFLLPFCGPFIFICLNNSR